MLVRVTNFIFYITVINSSNVIAYLVKIHAEQYYLSIYLFVIHSICLLHTAKSIQQRKGQL